MWGIIYIILFVGWGGGGNLRVCGLRWASTLMLGWGVMRMCLLLHQSLCGRIRMFGALVFVEGGDVL